MSAHSFNDLIDYLKITKQNKNYVYAQYKDKTYKIPQIQNK